MPDAGATRCPHDTILHGDALSMLRTLPSESVQCCVSSPPYWSLRDYGVPGQLGLEATPDEYVARMVEVFREVKRVLRNDGTCWVNMGDSYGGDRGNMTPAPDNKHRAVGAAQIGKRGGFDWRKQLLGMPWRLAFALQADGWYLRADIIWHKPNPMPESVSDRPTKSHEYIFLLSKRASYYYDAEAIREPHSPDTHAYGPNGSFEAHATRRREYTDERVMAGKYPDTYRNPAGRNKRSVWTVATAPFSDWAETSRLVRVPSDAAGDGTKRITSADCPVHGDRSAQVPTARCDPHADDVSNRNGHSDARPAQVPAGDCATIDQPPCADSVGGSSDLILLPCEPSATRHSKRTRKTGRDPVTTQPYMPSGETSGHIEYTSTQRGSADSVARTFVSNTATADSSDHPSAQTEHHNEGTFSSVTPPACTCSFYQEITEKTSHFATFPPKLIEPCILAGSASKACEHCGAPWRRVVETNYIATHGNRHPTVSRDVTGMDAGQSRNAARTFSGMRADITTGWQPTCRCADNTGSARSVVLDPFFGAGTVGVVCRRHSRHYLGIELNAAYVAMAETRIADEVQPVLWTAQEAG